MTNKEGWIKLHRSLLNWEWYDDVKVFRVFIHCLLKANHKDNNWRGVEIPAGSFISSYQKLSEETSLTVKQVRLSLNKLKRTNEVAAKSTSQYTMFQIVKYNDYQQEDKQKGKRGANKGQTEGKQRATNKNEKKVKNDNNEKNIYFSDDFVLNDKYLEFLNFRKEIKKPIKDVSINANIKQLMKLSNNQSDIAIEIIEQSIANGWQGFFEIKKTKNNDINKNNDRPQHNFDFDIA